MWPELLTAFHFEVPWFRNELTAVKFKTCIKSNRVFPKFITVWSTYPGVRGLKIKSREKWVRKIGWIVS